MKKITSLFVLFFILNTINAVPIGQWNAFLAYRNITDIEPAGNTIYVLSSNNLFSYNVNDHSINTYSKVFPLSDTGIRNIAWCNSANRLIIIYDNYNIDLLDNNQHVINVSGYMKASISQDKQINILAAAYDTDGSLASVRSLFSDFYPRMDITVYTNNHKIGRIELKMEAY